MAFMQELPPIDFALSMSRQTCILLVVLREIFTDASTNTEQSWVPSPAAQRGTPSRIRDCPSDPATGSRFLVANENCNEISIEGAPRTNECIIEAGLSCFQYRNGHVRVLAQTVGENRSCILSTTQWSTVCHIQGWNTHTPPPVRVPRSVNARCLEQVIAPAHRQ